MLDAEDIGKLLMYFILGIASLALGCFMIGVAFGFVVVGFRFIAG